MKLAQLNIPKDDSGPFEIPYPEGFKEDFQGEGAVGNLITSILPYVLIFGGLILLGMLIMGGFELLTAAGNQEKTAQGAARIKNALIGFLLLFAVFWLAQIFQVLFKIQIL